MSRALALVDSSDESRKYESDGARSYNHRKLDLDATHNPAAYASAGGELGVRRVRIRLEARDYVAGLKPLAGQGTARTSNDVVVMVGVRLG